MRPRCARPPSSCSAERARPLRRYAPAMNEPAAPETQPLGNYQYEIYARGLGGERPALPLAPPALEAAARGVLSPEAFGYVAGGAGAEQTMRANLQAFERVEIVPRMLRDVSVRDLSTTVLGCTMPAPLL